MKFICSLLLILFISASIITGQSGFTDQSGIQYLKENLAYLASDELEGRETATMGIELASIFIAEQLETYNVKPFGSDGTYFQPFPIIENKVDPRTELKIIDKNGGTKTLHVGKDVYLSMLKMPSDKYNNIKSDVVFVGYGLSSAEHDYDDYENCDVNGKVVLVMRGIPSYLPDSLFLEGESKMYGEVKYKITNAEEHGATGVILIPTGWILNNWQIMKKRALSPDVDLLIDNSEKDHQKNGSIPAVYISEEAVTELFQDEQYLYEEILSLLDSDEVLPVFNLNKKVVLNYKILNSVKTARNVIGIIEGRDKKLKNEYIILSAHYDHEGIVDGEIYNGADDNGSGTVSILEVARRISLLKENERSVVVVFHTGEEKGLLGSKYLTSHSKNINDIVANINVDMVGRGSTDTMFCIGSGRLSTELYDIVEAVNSKTVRFTLDYTYDNPGDRNRYFYRSDHYNYAKHNIPIVFYYDHMTEDYHKPTDDVDRINFKKLDKITTLITELALEISNLDHRLILDKTDK